RRRDRAPRGGPPGRCRAARVQLDGRGLRRPGSDPDPRDRAPSADQSVRRDEADVRGGAPLLRPGVRPPERVAPLFQRGRRDAAEDGAREVLGWSATRPTLEEMIGSAWDWRRRNLDAAGARLA